MGEGRAISEHSSGGTDVVRWTASLGLVLVLHMGASLAILRNLDQTTAPAAPPAMLMIDLPVDVILPQADSVASVAASAAAEVRPTEIVELTATTLEEAKAAPTPEAAKAEAVPAEALQQPPLDRAVETPVAATAAVQPVDQSEAPREMAVAAEKAVAPTEIGEAAVTLAEARPSEAVAAQAVVPAAAQEPVETGAKAIPSAQPTETGTTSPAIGERAKAAEASVADPVAPPAALGPLAPPRPRGARPVETPKPAAKTAPKPAAKGAKATRATPAPRQASDAAVNARASTGAGRSNPQLLARYLSQVRAAILRHRRSLPSGQSGRVTIRVTVTGSGGLSGATVVRSSGSAAIDGAAMAILRSVGSVPAIPAEVGRSSISLNVPFDFVGR